MVQTEGGGNFASAALKEHQQRLVNIIMIGLNFAIQDTMTAVNPRPPTMVVVRVWSVPAVSSRPIRPHIAPESTMVRMITRSTFMPA